jgi:hypothetical protein
MHHHAAYVSNPSKARVQERIVLNSVGGGSTNAHGMKANEIQVCIASSIRFTSVIVTVVFRGRDMRPYHDSSLCLCTNNAVVQYVVLCEHYEL